MLHLHTQKTSYEALMTCLLDKWFCWCVWHNSINRWWSHYSLQPEIFFLRISVSSNWKDNQRDNIYWEIEEEYCLKEVVIYINLALNIVSRFFYLYFRREGKETQQFVLEHIVSWLEWYKEICSWLLILDNTIFFRKYKAFILPSYEI